MAAVTVGALTASGAVQSLMPSSDSPARHWAATASWRANAASMPSLKMACVPAYSAATPCQFGV